MARIIPPGRARWRSTSSASTPAAACASSMVRCATKPSTKSAGSSSRVAATGHRDRAAPGARAVPGVHTASRRAPRSAHRRDSTAMRWRWCRTLRRRTLSSLPALCFWSPKRAKSWCYSGRNHESRPLGVVLHAPDRHLHHRDGNVVPDRFVLRWLGEHAAPPGPYMGQNAARGQLHPGARRGLGKAGSARRLRVRCQSRQLHGYSGAAFRTAPAVSLFRQEGTVPHPLAGHAPGACRTHPGGPVESARLIEEHDAGGAHHQRTQRLGVELSGRRALGRGAARIQGRPRVCRHQSRRARGAGGNRRHAGTVAHGLGPSAQRPGRVAGRRPNSHKRDEFLRPAGIDAAATPRGVATARNKCGMPSAVPHATLEP